MKRIQLTSLTVSLTFSWLLLCTACRKDNGAAGTAGGTYYMRFKAGGVQKEYLQNAAGNFNRQQTSNAGNWGSTFGATKEPFEAKKDNMALLLVTVGLSQQNIIYTNYATTAAGSKKAFISQAAYYDELGVFYTSWSDDFAPAIPAGTENNMKITITAATTTSLKGSFSGVLYNGDYSKKLVITDGDFLLQVK